MNRRSFLFSALAFAAAEAAKEVIPFNRVWSFPKRIVIPKGPLTPEIARLAETQIIARIWSQRIYLCPVIELSIEEIKRLYPEYHANKVVYGALG